MEGNIMIGNPVPLTFQAALNNVIVDGIIVDGDALDGITMLDNNISPNQLKTEAVE